MTNIVIGNETYFDTSDNSFYREGVLILHLQAGEGIEFTSEATEQDKRLCLAIINGLNNGTVDIDQIRPIQLSDLNMKGDSIKSL